MSASSASGNGANRSFRRSGKVIPLPKPRRSQKRAVRVGSVVVALGLISALALRVDSLHSARLRLATVHSPLAAQEFRLLKAVNDERAKAGLPPFQFSPRIMMAARSHSQDMADRSYLGHDSPAGDTPADRIRDAGLNYDEIGENLYTGAVSDMADLPKAVVTAWMQNPQHRANMLSASYQLSAVGVVRAGDGSYYITEDFIR